MKKRFGLKNDVGVYWLDAVIYAKPKKWWDIKPIRTFTTGILYKENKDWIVIKAPLTYEFDNEDNDYKPKIYDGEPIFFSIPKGMIVKIVPGEIEPLK